MKCNNHSNDAHIICPSCGKALCPECIIVSGTTRNACSDECMNNLKTLDAAAFLSVTKAKKSLTANVIFCRLLGIVFIVVGLFFLFFGMEWLMLTGFLSVMGIAFLIGAQIYASAIKDKQTL